MTVCTKSLLTTTHSPGLTASHPKPGGNVTFSDMNSCDVEAGEVRLGET
jgi:hypothetical protein